MSIGDEPAHPTGTCYACEGHGVDTKNLVMCPRCKGDGQYDVIGLTKRELFAAMAMQGLEAGLGVESRRFELLIIIADSESITVAEAVAKECVVTADALLAELERTK